jgi:hemerythrin superfamily protein
VDAITLLKQDHREVNGLFRRFEKLGDDAKATKGQVVTEIVRALSQHAAVEETVFYPAVKGISDDLKQHVLESLEEHHVVKWLCSELDGMDPSDERFDAKTTVLMENVRHHVEEEEHEFFPQVREALGRKTLGELGDLLAQAKKTAPTHPHPRSPDEPPFNAMSSLVAAFIDRARDAAAKVAQRTAHRTRSSAQGSRPASKRVTSTRPGGTRRVSSTARSTTAAASTTAARAAGRGRATATRATTTAARSGRKAASGVKKTARRARAAARS